MQRHTVRSYQKTQENRLEDMDEQTQRNLMDAGCPEPLIDEFATLRDPDEQIRWLRRYRRDLLAGIHSEQKKLDCLDYLIFSLRNDG